MLGLDPNSLKLAGALMNDTDKLKDFLNLWEMAPAIFKAFEEAHPLRDEEEKATIFIQTDKNGQLWISGAAMDGNGVPVRVLFHWNYQKTLNALSMDALLDKKDLLASGQLNWSQIRTILKGKQEK